MKTIKKIFLICLISVFAASCVDELEFGSSSLEKPPGVDFTIDTVFNNPIYAQRFLWDTYSTLHYGMPWDWSLRGSYMNMGTPEAMTDNWQSYLSWDYSNRNIYSGKYNSTEENRYSKYNYTQEGGWIGVRKAYILLENIDRTPGLDDYTRNRLKGEAKMVIACHYSDMFRHFGGLPLVKKSLDVEDVAIIDRSTAKETLEFITDLCDEAKTLLPWTLPADEKATWDGRFTGGAASGLKIRMLLFGASPLFNDNQPYYTEKISEANTSLCTWYGSKDDSMWNDVIAECETFFNANDLDGNGGYRLYRDLEDPRLNYRAAYFNRGNPEMLISTRQENSIAYDEAFNYFIGSTAVPVLEYLDQFPMSDGTPFDNSVWNDSIIEPYKDPWADRDPRLYETAILNNQTYQDRVAEIWFGGRERGTAMDWSAYYTGAGNFKFGLDKKLASGKPAHWPYLRLAEIYLSYAEALNEAGRMNDAFYWVDEVRGRVGLKGLKESNPSIAWTKDILREEILRERSCEFGREEVRWYDLIRWKRAQDFRKPLHGLLIKQVKNAADNVVPGKFKHIKFCLTKRYWQDGNNGEVYFSPKWYLSAFPLNEVYKNADLPQNPGWE